MQTRSGEALAYFSSSRRATSLFSLSTRARVFAYVCVCVHKHADLLVIIIFILRWVHSLFNHFVASFCALYFRKLRPDIELTYR